MAATLLCPGARAFADDPVDSEEKVETPRVDKLIGEVAPDGDVSWGKLADAEVGVAVPYRITGTLPSNWDDFKTYYYEFHDVLDPQLIIDESSVRIELLNSEGTVAADLTDAFSTSVSSDNVLSAQVADLKAAAPGADKSCTVRLSYFAALDPATATPGTQDPADNYVYLNYTSRPWTDAIGRSVEDHAQLLTWGIDLDKVDAETAAKLAGAVFTVQNAAGQYVAADGQLSSAPVEHTTGEDGLIKIPGVDAGTYTVTEVAAPLGYATLDGSFQIVLTSKLSGDAPTLAASVSHAAVSVPSIDAAAGVAVVEVADDRVTVPPTGGSDQPNAPPAGTLTKTADQAFAIVAAAGIVACIALAVACAARRRDARR